jgi:hypothetical protein
MESLQLKIENRTSPYFGKYKYRAQCRVMGACYTYYTRNLEQFKNKLENTKANRNQYRISVLNSRFEETYDHIDFEQISKFFDWKNNKDSEKFMYRVQGNQVSFFSNDLELLKSLTDIDPGCKFSMAEVMESNIMYFKKEPKYKYRTFFKGRKAPLDFTDNINNLQEMYGDKFHFSPGMVRTMAKYQHSSYRYMHTSYYVDYNDPSMLTILGLWFNDILAKTYSLQKEP